MELTRRFVFRGNASAYSGQIYRRQDQRLTKPVIVVTGATSSLTVVGGQSSGQSRSAKFLDGFIRVGNAGTEAWATFTDFKQAALMTQGEVTEESLTASTKVSSWVENLVIGKDPKQLKGRQPEGREKESRLSIGWIGGSLTSLSPKEGQESSIRLVGKETDVKDVFIDGYQLKVTLNKAEFDAFDTMSKLHTAANDPAFVDQTGDCMFSRERAAASAGADVARPDVVRSTAKLHGTIVKKLEWARGQQHPTATIDHNCVVVPEFGVVYFGEISVTSDERRLTMLRVRFGSPVGGMYACSEIDTNGSWVPPF